MTSSHHIQHFVFQPYSVRLIWLQKSCHSPKPHYDFQDRSKGTRNGLFFSDPVVFISKANLWEFPLLTFCYDAWARSKSWLFVTMREAGEMSLSYVPWGSPLVLDSSPRLKSGRGALCLCYQEGCNHLQVCKEASHRIMVRGVDVSVVTVSVQEAGTK